MSTQRGNDSSYARTIRTGAYDPLLRKVLAVFFVVALTVASLGLDGGFFSPPSGLEDGPPAWGDADARPVPMPVFPEQATLPERFGGAVSFNDAIAATVVALSGASLAALWLLRSGTSRPEAMGAGSRRRVALREEQDEKELLRAVERHGEITPTRVALETSLTVAEADRRLSELAAGGYLEVHVRDGKLLYAL